MGGSSGVLAKKVADRVSMLMISVITAENAAGTASHSTTLTVNGSGLLSSPISFSFIYACIYTYIYTFIFRFLHNSGKKTAP